MSGSSHIGLATNPIASLFFHRNQAFCSGEGLIRLTTEGKSASYTFNGNAEKFDAGMQTTLNLTLKTEDSNVDLEFSNQTYWVYGVTAPDFPGKENIYSARPGSKIRRRAMVPLC